MFLTDFWKKLRIYLWSLGIFTFLWVLAPSWQHLGCQFLHQLGLVELYYWLIDLNQDSKVIQGVKWEKLYKTMKILMFFVNFQLNQIQNWAIPEKIQTEGVQNILFSTPPPPLEFYIFLLYPWKFQAKQSSTPLFGFFLEQPIVLSRSRKWKTEHLADDARHKNVPPSLDLTKILKSCHKRNDRRKFLEK